MRRLFALIIVGILLQVAGFIIVLGDAKVRHWLKDIEQPGIVLQDPGGMEGIAIFGAPMILVGIILFVFVSLKNAQVSGRSRWWCLCGLLPWIVPLYVLAVLEDKSAEKEIADYTKELELNPDCAELFYHRGVTYIELGEHGKAIPDFTKAIQLSPHEVLAYIDRGITYIELAEYGKAIDDFTQVIQLVPNDALAYCNRGIAYDGLGEYEKAISNYTKAIQLDETFEVAYFKRGLAYGNQGDFNKVLIEFSKVIEFDSTFAPAYHGRGLAYQELGDEDKADADFTKAKELGLELPEDE